MPSLRAGQTSRCMLRTKPYSPRSAPKWASSRNHGAIFASCFPCGCQRPNTTRYEAKPWCTPANVCTVPSLHRCVYTTDSIFYFLQFTLYNPETSAVGLEEPLGVPGRLPSDHPPPPGDWRDRCPAHKWYFTAPGANEESDLRINLATVKLTDAVLKRTQFARGSTQYRKSVPWRLREELENDSRIHPLGWGFVLRFEFDMVVFLCIWFTVAVLLSVGLLGLYIAPSGPAHGQPGVAVAIFMAPIGFVGTWFGFACAYGKQRKYLD